MIHRRSTLALLLLLLVLGRNAAAQESQAFPAATPESVGLTRASVNALRDEVAEYVKMDTIVGGELLIVKDRKTVLHEAFGDRDREDKKLMERNTIFNIRSMTKPLTGVAMQMLIDEGKVKLDEPAAKYLPGFDNDKSRTITIRQLLEHRSGLPLTVIALGINQYPNLQKQAQAAGEKGPQFKPDEKFWYSDAGTDAVAAIVEKVSGKLIDEFVQERILQPLGMSDSFYPGKADDVRKQRIASLYIGKPGKWGRFWKAGGQPMYPFAWGSQTLYSTSVDYARFLTLWMDGGKVNGKPLLSAEAMKRILTPASNMSVLGGDASFPTGFRGLKTFYGQMAVLHGKGETPARAKVEVIGHSGSDGTIAWAFPEKDLIICFFTQSRGQATSIRLETSINRELLQAGEPIVPVPAEWKPYLGTYYANFGQYKNTPFKVLFQDGHLAVDIPDQLVFELNKPDSEGRWAFVISDKISVSFKKDATGKVVSMNVKQGGNSFDLPVEPLPETKLKKEEVEKYLGKYEREEDKIMVDVVFKDGKLLATIPSTGIEVELTRSADKKSWTSPNTPGATITFDNEQNGKCMSFSVNAANGKKLQRKRIDN
jgi:CubicO group peptidase (beta-lactamase class C family)